MNDDPVIDFYFSAPSRYSYLASTQLDDLEAKYDCSFRWLPVRNRDVMEHRGTQPFHHPLPPSGQYDWSYREYDAKCWAAYYGVPYVEPENFRQDPPYISLACYAAEAQGGLRDYVARLFAIVFVESGQVLEADLPRVAEEAGLDAKVFQEALVDPLTQQRYREVLKGAIEKKVFGVPTFIWNDHFYWGNDRLILLEKALKDQRAQTTDSP